MGYRKLFVAALIPIMGLWSTIALSQASDWYLGGQASYVEPDDARSGDDGIGWRLRMGTPVAEYLDLEIVGGGLTYQRSTTPRHEERYNLGLDGLLVFNRGGFSPHLAFGGGAAYNDTFFDSSTGGYLDAGLGFRAPLIDNGLKMRFDARYVADFTDEVVRNEDTLGDIRISLGVELPLGGEAAPTDRDGDGVPDERDQCPNTPDGKRVGPDGCPLDADGDGVADAQDRCPGTPGDVEVGPDGCPRDSDGDGVPDHKDQCPNTPSGTRVNASGCAQVVDSDGDGVPDDQDQCPNTPEGAKVLTNGCGVGQSAILQGVNFEFDKAVLTNSARDILTRVAQTLKDSPGFRLELAGHTDSVGSAAYNRDLSQRRADSAKEYLVGRGIDPGRLETRGYGESQPIATNETEEGRATNRRTELRVIDRQ